MKENPMTTIYLMLLLLHAHLSICNGLVSVSVVGLNSVKIMKSKQSQKGLRGEVGQCLGRRWIGKANPYNRGCEVITGCARGVRDINS
ncbi:hypothetical protein AAG906_013085 [Vitis piasezkii]